MISDQKTTRYAIIGLAALAWLVCVITLYYLVHKPFSSEDALRAVESLWRIIISIGLISIAGGLGRKIIRRGFSGSAAELALQAALGLGIISFVSFLVGISIGYQALLVWVITISAALAARREILGWWFDWRKFIPIYRLSGKLGKSIFWMGALCGLSALAAATLPPVKFDSLVYHLTLPEAYLQSDRLFYNPQNIFSGMPQLGELLFTWAGALGGVRAAMVMSWCIPILAVIGLLGLVHNRLGARPAFVSAGSLLVGISLTNGIGSGYIDWLVILFSTAFLIVVDRWHEQMDSSLFWLSGFLVGLALATKYTAGILLIGGCALILWHLTQRVNPKWVVLACAQFLTLAFLVNVPWLIKNITSTGNPFFPFIIPSQHMNAIRLDFYQSGRPWGDARDLVLLPVMATVLGREGAPGYNATIGPLLLGLAPLSLIGYRRFTSATRSLLRASIILSVVGIALWAVLGRLSPYLIQSRLYFVIFPSFAVLAGAGFASLARTPMPGIRLGRVAGALILFVMLMSTYEVIYTSAKQGVYTAFLFVKDEKNYLETNLGMHIIAMQAIDNLPEDKKVLLLFEPRSFYCLPRCEPDEILDRWYYDLRMLGTPEKVLDSWRRAGFTNLLYHQDGAEFLKSEDERFEVVDWEALQTMLADLPVVQQFGKSYTLFSLEQ